ncbi:MAG TPA: hypothetical protein VF591_08100 [Pyrinomonadaceae bacterium]|jgi:hypothetical protein
MTNLRRFGVLTLGLASVLAAMFHSGTAASYKQGSGKRGRPGRAPLTVLQSSRKLLEASPEKKSLAAPTKTGQYALSLGADGSVTAFDRGGKFVKRIPLSARDARALAVDSSNNIYLAGADSVLRVFNFEGRQLKEFPIPDGGSVGVLSDGNVVVAAPSGGKLLHLFSPAGEPLSSFADVKAYDADARENEFLNRGKVVVGPSDEIYLVSVYAPLPYVARFTERGALIKEFIVDGDAVAFQKEKADGFLAERKPNMTGGVTVINSAAVEPATGHLWVALNGLSTTATLYEYDSSGVKLREYALLGASPSGSRNITHPKDIIVDGASIRVLSWGELYDFNQSDAVGGAGSARNRAKAGRWAWDVFLVTGR